MKPMLAGKADLAKVQYPVMVSPKLDGIRCLVIDGVACARSLKPIPNKHVQKCFGRPEFNGLDGELIVGDPTGNDVYNRTSSGVMSIEGRPEVTFHVFDDFSVQGRFEDRLKSVVKRVRKLSFGPVESVIHNIVIDDMGLGYFTDKAIDAGYEGVMLRDPSGPYKHGRSTTKEGWLLKVKLFDDGEAEIIGFQELMHNTNEAKTNELGHKERSSKKAGMVGKGCLGALRVKDLKTDVVFDIGTGFTQQEREDIWSKRHGDSFAGVVVKYKHQPHGALDKPRFPVFLGFRDEVDMS